MLSRKGFFVVAMLGALIATPGLAQTASDTFDVSITVENSCTISVNNLNFGTVTDPSSVSGSTTGSVTCANSAPVSVSFDAGDGGSSTYTTRQMDDGSTNTVDFNLYDDAAHTTVLGDGSGSTTVISLTSTGGGTPDSIDIYGLTEAGQSAAPVGTYISTVTATVTF